MDVRLQIVPSPNWDLDEKNVYVLDAQGNRECLIGIMYTEARWEVRMVRSGAMREVPVDYHTLMDHNGNTLTVVQHMFEVKGVYANQYRKRQEMLAHVRR